MNVIMPEENINNVWTTVVLNLYNWKTLISVMVIPPQDE